MSTRTRRRALVPALLGVVVLLLTAACQGGNPSAEPSAPSASKLSGQPTIERKPRPRWPFTGTRVPQGRTATAPAFAVKIDNTAGSRPQLGLARADLVVEELVEGGLTRLAVFFQRHLPTKVGPVRSMRGSDVGIIGPADVPVVTSGAAAVVKARLDRAGIRRISLGSPAVYRSDQRPAPYDVMANLRKLGKKFGQRKKPPPAYLPWGSAKQLPHGTAARSIAITFSATHTTRFRYRDGTYWRTNGYAPRGKRFPADTVLVLRVPVGRAGYLDPAGNPVPLTKLKGHGRALLAHHGRVVRGTWHKPSLEATLRLSRNGEPMPVPPGRTWIALVPREQGSVSFR